MYGTSQGYGTGISTIGEYQLVPFLLRKIRKNKWSTENLSWINSGELQADCLGDMGTKDNKLSVYRISDDKSNLNRVAAALAATCDNISNFDYLLFNEDLLQIIGIKSEKTEGNTSDESVNSSHIDLVEISLSKLVNLANIASKDGERARILQQDIKFFLVESFRNGYINRKIVKLKSAEIEKIEKLV
ncbi:hypothetical protein QT970_12660 [Microcoleus sp. herbarium8]|uniref:hypothetical protein n=1 Tax=Microcoleus sp. herbarium8 TaxID=3055436 RepID=UPI002FD4A430